MERYRAGVPDRRAEGVDGLSLSPDLFARGPHAADYGSRQRDDLDERQAGVDRTAHRRAPRSDRARGGPEISCDETPRPRGRRADPPQPERPPPPRWLPRRERDRP